MMVASAVPRCSFVRSMIGPMLVMTVSSCRRTLPIPVKFFCFLISGFIKKSFSWLASGHQSAKNLPDWCGFIGPTPPVSWPVPVSWYSGGLPQAGSGSLGCHHRPQCSVWVSSIGT